MTEQAPALIVKLSVKVWGATRTDKEAGDMVAAANGATPDAGKYVKNLIDRGALKAIRADAQVLRDTHKALTRPWDDDGRRLLPVAMADTYRDQIDAYKRTFDLDVGVFVREYAGLRDFAQMNLGGLFSEADYPSEAEIADKFQVSLEYEPVPQGQYAPPGYEEQVERDVKARMKASADELIYRIVNTLKDFNRKLIAHDERVKAGDLKGRFRLSVSDDLKLLVDLLPALNIENDPFVNGVIARLKAELNDGAVPAELVRDSTLIREKIIAKTQRIIDDIEQNKP